MNEYLGLDVESPQGAQIVANLQGNILKGHGRDHATLLLLKFPREENTIEKIRGWIRTIPVTSAQQQLVEATNYRRYHTSGNLFHGFYLSAAGYRALGYSEFSLPRDLAFRGGMKKASRPLADPPTSRWEASYREDFDALLLVADDSSERVAEEVNHIRRELWSLTGSDPVKTTEVGIKLLDELGRSIEHFGYVDGVSQPLFLKEDINRYRSTNPSNVWDPSANPFHLVLVTDPLAPECYGSYLVFRKLSQIVSEFERVIDALARILNRDKAFARALVVGRFADGTPLALSGKSQNKPEPDNTFDYSNDLLGVRCPFHAHIRKLNSRLQAPMDRARRIARRGIPYGRVGAENNEDRGLLFLCFQQDISRQFEFLQRFWANNTKFPAEVGHVGLDPIIGQVGMYEPKPTPQLWPKQWGDEDEPKAIFNFSSFVLLKGGEYFFAPSLKSLGRI